MTDNYSYSGVDMTMTCINAEGNPEPIKNRKIKQHIEMLLSRDVTALQQQHDAYVKAAQIAQAKKEARKGKAGFGYLHTVKKNLQMAAAYKAVIESIHEETA